MGSVRRALTSFDVTKIAVGTPYADELNTNVAKYLTECGFSIVEFQGLNLTRDNEMIKVSPEYLIEFAQEIERPDGEAVLISCGALRTIDLVDEIEQLLGKPVICSNQAMLWHCLRLAAIEGKLEGLGGLLREH